MLPPDIALREAPGNNGFRTVQKRGVLIEGAWFISDELDAYIGKSVQVRLDQNDMGRIYVFSIDEEFICVAECPERTV